MSFIGKPTNFLSFGAVKFNPEPKAVPCTTNALYCQPTEQIDDIAFQFEVSESTELITNGDFASPSGWTFVGWLRLTSLGETFASQIATVNAVSQKGILTIGDSYKVTLTVSNFPGGNLAVGGGTGVNINNGIGAIQSNGTFTGFFEYNEAGGDGDFIISGSAGTSISVRVDDISVVKISDPSDYDIQIINQETETLIDTVPPANIRLVAGIITVDFNWGDLSVPNGCRQIQIIDNTNLFEDTFSTNQGWTVDPAITFPGTQMLYTSIGAPNLAFIEDVFIVGESYEITIITASITGSANIRLSCGNTTGSVITTNTTLVQTLVCTNNGRLSILFIGAAASTAEVDNLTIKKTDNIAARSECYDLQTSHDCSLLFKWSNNESWGGFDYTTPAVGDAFVHALRVESKFRGTKYPSVRNIGEDSAGVKQMDYTSLRKQKILDINHAPDYIHDAIAAMFMQDTRTIEDISYVLIDEYEPSTPNDSVVLFKDTMTARIELEESTQANQINRNL